MNYQKIANAFQTAQIMVPLVPEGKVEASEPSYEAWKRLNRMGFDYGVVCEQGRVIGFVETRRLAESVNYVSVENYIHLGSLDNLPSETTSVSELIKMLCFSPFQLVARGREIIGLVTESDLNRHPVYAYFYFLLSGMEQNLFEIVRKRFPREEHWLGFLEKRAQTTARGMREKAIGEGLELDLIHYLFLPQYIGIIANADDIICEFGFTQKRQWHDFGERLRKFRNDVMHPIKPLVGKHRNVNELADLEDRIRRLIAGSEAVLGKLKNQAVTL